MARIINLDGSFAVNIIMDMNERPSKYNLIKSLVINAVILIAVLACTDMGYETNDDFAIASRIVDGYPEVFFVNWFLAFVLTKLQALTAVLNVHVFLMVAASFLAFVSILKLIMDRSSHVLTVAAACAVIAVFSFDHYCTIQFTKASTLVITAGAMLLMDAFMEHGGKGQAVAGLLLLFYGSALRIEGLVVVSAFTGLCFLKYLIDIRHDFKKEMGGKRAAAFALIILAVICCFGSEFVSRKMNSRNEALAYYNDYNYYRSEVVDFSRLDYYEEQKADYDKAGFSKNDIELIRKWYFDYDGAASLENLTTILEISKRGAHDEMTPKKAVKEFIRGTKNSFDSKGLTAVHIIVLSVLALWALLSVRPSGKLLVIVIGIMTAVFHIYLYYIGRMAYRVAYVPDVCAAMWLLYILTDADCKKKTYTAAGVIAILVCILMIVPAYAGSAGLQESTRGRVMPEELSSYLQSNDGNFYVTSTSEKKSNPSYPYPLRAPDTKMEKNYMGAGSWGTASPYLLGKLGEYGLSNPIKDLIDAPNAYYLGNKNTDKLTEYYNKWYGGDGRTIRMEKTDEVGGMGVWKVVSESSAE